MVDVLMGRTPPPADFGVSTLMELAEAYHARAREMSMILHQMEADGLSLRGGKLYKFRTGELRDFTELTSKAIDMGSRRITMYQEELKARG